MIGTLLLGISIGVLLFLVATGLTLILGLLGIVNFAHGSIYMVGAYVGVQMITWTGNFWFALLAAPVAGALLGIVIEFLCLRPIYHRPHHFQFLMTLGLLLILEELVRLVWGLDFHRMDVPPQLAETVTLSGVTFSAYRIFVVLAGVLAILFFWVLDRTPLGLLVRACQLNSSMASSLGINVNRVRTAVVAGGAALAALAGTISGPLVPIEPTMGFRIIIDCFIVVVVGGVGDIRGAALAAMLIGLTRAFGQQYLPDWVSIATYSVLLFTLIVRPAGIFSFRLRQS
jgi:branched-chain amino acid transport system permease protein